MVKNHRGALVDIFKKLDAEVTGANVFSNVVMLLTEMIFGGKASTFFGRSAQETSEDESSGNATESTEENEK